MSSPCTGTAQVLSKVFVEPDTQALAKPPAQVIPGWTEAMQSMVEGDKWEMYIPSDLAYGTPATSVDERWDAACSNPGSSAWIPSGSMDQGLLPLKGSTAQRSMILSQ